MAARFGVFVPQGWRQDLNDIADPAEAFEAMVRVAKQADEGSWDSIWVYDHFHTIPEPSQNVTFECWTSSAALARETTRVNVGQMVGCNGYRQPSLYAKTASTVDAMSHGRLYAGIGAGWYEHEWKAYGYEWTDIPPRMKAFREAVEIVHAMWTEDAPTYDGEHYRIDEPINLPRSAAPGRKIPLWIGGGGEKVTLKLVAQYGDACNIGAGSPRVVREKLDVLRRHCDRVGRDIDDITISTSINAFPMADDDGFEQASAKARGSRWSADEWREIMTLGAEQIRSRTEAVLEAGADYVIYYVPGLAYDDELLPAMEQIIAGL